MERNTHTQVELPRIIITLDNLKKFTDHYRIGDHGIVEDFKLSQCIVEIDNMKWWQFGRRSRIKKFYNHAHKLMSVRVTLKVERGLSYRKNQLRK